MRAQKGTEGMSENPTRLSLPEFFDQHGCTALQIVRLTSCGEKPGPALCAQDCTVDLDGICPHRCPSVLLTLMQYGYEWEDILGSSICGGA
jgi:hypothetical protein